jgi:putative SOS response-associated peptidase YedK
MCGRFANNIPVDELAEYYAAVVDGEIPTPSWNIAPTNTVATVLDGTDHHRHLAPAQWNFLPAWAKKSKLDYPTHNARVESILEKRTYEQSARAQRCIIPASGYYEWDARGLPHYFTNPDGKPLSIAGLFNWWRARRNDLWVLTVTIITRQSTAQAAEVHDRMPVLIADDLRDKWLNRRLDGQAIIPAAAEEGACQSSALTSWPVGALQGDGPSLIHPRISQI